MKLMDQFEGLFEFIDFAKPFFALQSEILIVRLLILIFYFHPSDFMEGD